MSTSATAWVRDLGPCPGGAWAGAVVAAAERPDRDLGRPRGHDLDLNLDLALNLDLDLDLVPAPDLDLAPA